LAVAISFVKGAAVLSQYALKKQSYQELNLPTSSADTRVIEQQYEKYIYISGIIRAQPSSEQG